MLLLTACHKSEPAPKSLIGEKLLKTWKVAKVTQTGNSTPLYQNPLPGGQTNTEDYNSYTLSFLNSTDYTLTGKDNSLHTGKWELASNETKIILDKGVQGAEIILTIVEIKDASLKVNVTENSTKTGSRELQMDFTSLSNP